MVDRFFCTVISTVLVVIVGLSAYPRSVTTHEGDIIVKSGTVLTIRDVTYLQAGSIEVMSGGKLVVQSASLTLLMSYQGEHVVRVCSGGQLDMADASLNADHLFELYAEGSAKLFLSDVKGVPLHPWLLGSSSASFRECQIDILHIGEHATATLDSCAVLTAVRMEVEGSVLFRNLKSGRHEMLHLPSGFTGEDLPFSLSLSNTEVNGWIVMLEPGSQVKVEDSELLHVALPVGGAKGTIVGLHPGHFDEWDTESLITDCPCHLHLHNVSLTGPWFLGVWGDTRLRVQDSELLLVLSGKEHLTVSNCAISYLELDHDQGSLFFDHSTLTGTVLLVGARASWDGEVTVLPGMEWGGWNRSFVSRTYVAQVVDPLQRPIPNTLVQVVEPSGNPRTSQRTNAKGEVRFVVTFDDSNYRAQGTVSVVGTDLRASFGVLSSNRIVFVIGSP